MTLQPIRKVTNPKPRALSKLCVPGAFQGSERTHRKLPVTPEGAAQSCWDQELLKAGQSIFRSTESPGTQGVEFWVFYATEYEDFLLLLNMLFLETILLVFMGIFPMGQHFQLRPLHK